MLVPDVLIDAAREAGCADPEKCRKAIDEALTARRSVVEAVLDSQAVEEGAFLEKLAARLRLGFVEMPPSNGVAPMQKLPARLALRHKVYPGEVTEHEMKVYCFDPFDLDARHAVAQHSTKRFRWVLAPRQTILDALRQGYGVGGASFDDILEGRTGGGQDDDEEEVVNIVSENEEATIMGFVNRVFLEALAERATDIHIEPLERDLRIRYRVDGALQEVPVPPNMRLLQAALISRLKIMANLDIAERRMPQDGRISLEVEGQRIDVRMATIPSINGESVSLRLLSRERYEISTLGLDSALETRVREVLASPNGIILVTGPTGSGKSTTLYTFLRLLNTKQTRIVTIEDPVENKLDGVVQIAVKPEIGLTFAHGLRSILRGDPNVIMVGEMRDLETAEIAIQGALTGHLVLSTLHTNDAIGGISRLLDMGIEPFLIASSVRAFLAQRLVRTLCPACKVSAEHKEHYLDYVGFPKEYAGRMLKAVGCRECRMTGYRGRMALVEMCVIDSEMSELITERATLGTLRAKALEKGMVPLREYGWKAVIDGQTTIEEVLSATAADQPSGGENGNA